jgi:hypothetical protein
VSSSRGCWVFTRLTCQRLGEGAAGEGENSVQSRLSLAAAGMETAHYAGAMSPEESPQNRRPEVDPEDLRMHGDAALRLANDLGPGEISTWANLVNSAASMAEIEDQD